MKNIIILLLSITSLSTSLLAQEDAQVFRHGKLHNGLTYYVRHTKMQPGKADFYLVQNVGALMEEDNQNGLAHFLEHMAFNGSESFKEGIPNFLKRRGVTRFNAHTGQDETVYYMTGVPTNDEKLVDSCILVMKDWSGFLLLNPKEIDKERGVIQEERRSRRDMGIRLREQADIYLYNYSKYATHNVIGSEEIIKNFTPEELRAYYRDFYRPDQQAVIVVGDVDAEKTEAEIKRLFNPIPKRINPKPRLAAEIPDNEEPFYVSAVDKEVPEPSLLLIKRIKRTPAETVKELMKTNIIKTFYNKIMEKYLKAFIDTDDALFMSAMVNYGELVRDYDCWNVYVQAFPNKENKALKQILEEIERIHRFSLNSKELKEQIDVYLLGLDETEKNKDQLSNEVYVQIYQNNFLLGNPITSVDEDIALSREILSELTEKDLHEWVASWSTDNKNWTFIMQGNDRNYPFPTKEEITGIMEEVHEKELTPRDYDIEVAPLMDFEVKGGEIVKVKKIKTLDAEEWTLTNGCKVYYKFNDSDGMKVSLMGESPGGKSLIPAEDLPSAAALSALMMRSGLYKHDMRMMTEIMKGHQIHPAITLNETYEGVSGYGDSSEAEMLFQIIYLIFEKPLFNRNDFDKFVYLSKMQYKNTPRTVNDTISEAIENLRIKDSPRKWKTDEKFYDAMNYDKMIAIYRDRFQDASDFRFYLTGNIRRDEAQQLVKQYLGAIPSTYRKEQPVRHHLEKEGSITETIEANIPDNKYMVTIEFTNKLKLKPEEELMIDVIREILSNRYQEIIREDEGGAYGVQVGASYNEFPVPNQVIGIRFQTNTEKGDRMRAIVHEQIRKIATEGATEEEVEDIVLMMKQGRAQMLASRGNVHWMSALQYYVFTGKNIDSPALFEKPLEKLTAKKMLEFARKYFESAICTDIVIKSKTK